MNSCELTTAITAVANGLACNKTSGEIALLAAVLVQLGDTLATIATQRAFCEEIQEETPNR